MPKKRKLNRNLLLKENLTDQEAQDVRDIIRMELASIFFDLFKKRKAWM